MSEYRRYNLTLMVADPSARDRFRLLSRPESFFEIRPNRSPGQRGAYSVEMTQDEYEAALEDAANPESNLIHIEPTARGYDLSVLDSAALEFHAASNADSLGLSGKGVDVGIIESGYVYAGSRSPTPPDPSNILEDVFSGRVKGAKGFGESGPISNRVPRDPYKDGTEHGVEMASLAVPPASQIVAAAYDNNADTFAAAIYWIADEIGADIISMSQAFSGGGGTGYQQVIADALAHARGKNILLFAAAGNAGNNQVFGPGQNFIDYPASDPNVNAISNYNPNTDAINFTSNFGSKVWAAADGGPITAISDPDPLGAPYGGFERVIEDGGTSAAAAVASHMAARFMTGGRSPGNVESYLADNARSTAAGPLYEGRGILQLAAAEQALQQDKPEQVDLNGDPIEGSDGSTQDGTGNPDPGACG